MKTVYLGLGSNLGDRRVNLRQAVESLQTSGVNITRRSSVYETAPQDLVEQPWFMNMVVEAETAMFPRQLLACVHRIEADLGRRRLIAKGPRIIDIDILLYGSAVVEAPDLTIPHPRMQDRRFVLEPLEEIRPGLVHPLTHRTIRSMIAQVSNQEVFKLEEGKFDRLG